MMPDIVLKNSTPAQQMCRLCLLFNRILKFLRCHSGVFFVETEEIRVVFESRGEAGVCYGISAVDEVVDEVNAAKDKIIVKRNTDLLAEKMTDVIFAVIKSVRDVGEGNVLGIVSIKILQDLKNEPVFDARGFIGRLAAVNGFAYRGEKLNDLTSQKDGIGAVSARCSGEDIFHKKVAADLAQTVRAENVSNAALSFIKGVEKSRVTDPKAVGDALADVERDALECFVIGYGAAVQLGGIEDYHIARTEGV